MTTPSFQPRRIDPPLLFFALLMTLLGGYIRFVPALLFSFPVNDGGLFYAMTRDLLANGLRLPVFVSYNGLEIPFSYPPLAFYLASLVHALLQLPLLDIFRFVPAAFSAATILAFFLLASDLIEARIGVALATFAFAFLPSAFYWPVMGGGLTRSAGLFFSLLALWAAYRLYRSNSRRYIVVTAIFSACAVMSHPEAALHTASGALVIFLFFGWNRAGWLKSLAVAALTLLLTAPWWLTVLLRHGLSPFLAASRTGGYRIDLLVSLLNMNLTSEPAITFIGCFAILGLFMQLARRDYFWPVWGLAIVLTEQRSALLHLSPWLALLAGAALGEVIFPRLRQLEAGGEFASAAPLKNWAETLLSGRVSKLLVGFLLLSFILSAFEVAYVEAQKLTLSDGDRAAFEWINANLGERERFLLLTGDQPLADPVSEWFPALTEQVSVATVQGYEWLPAADFNAILVNAFSLQRCVIQDVTCLESWSAQNEPGFEYLYLSKARIVANFPALSEDVPLQTALLATGDFELIYETRQAAILRKR